MAHLVKSQTASSDKNRWATTWDCYHRAVDLFGREFDVDVAAEPLTAKCNKFISYKAFDNPLGGEQVGVDALAEDTQWLNNWWCNPPFDEKKAFIEKAVMYANYGLSGMMLLPYEPCTKWFRELIIPHATAVYVPDGRYNFLETDGVTKKTGVNFPSCFILFTPHFNGGEAKIININR